MIIRPKHYLLFILGLILASFIFYVNYVLFQSNQGPIVGDLLLSLFTFILWWVCWALYFEMRDFWQFRWYGKQVNHPNVSITPFLFPLTWEKEKPNENLEIESFLSGELLHWNETSQKSPIVIFSHGFSDDSKYVRHYTVPIALAGYDVIAYDCRGVSGSRKAGKTNQFVEITHDLGDIIRFLQDHKAFKGRSIYLVGISLGSVASIKQGLLFQGLGVEKIVAVACIGDYSDVMPSSPIPFKRNWWFWLRYTFFGVPINPLPEIKKEISPELQILEKKKEFSSIIDWQKYAAKSLFLIHSRNDKVISAINFKKNITASEIPLENWLITQRGGHNFLKYELILTSAIIERLKR
ncbi:alpha/beta hydrolase [Candidatus Lokiarchaeum ossiferum]|uniref:alpha/beta hydrolase n=1 Tax=Candidatus Lokiarchaeum ossiferum TaxID=2951803 RepID=UPI00352D940D